MSKNKIIRFFVLGFVYFAFLLNAMAVEPTVLTQIKVLQNEDNSYTLDLGFGTEYKGKAFVQKQNEKSHFVFLPDTTLNQEKIKLYFTDKDIKNNIEISIDEKKFENKNKEINYLRLNVDTIDDANIKLVSSIAQTTSPFSYMQLFNWQNGIIFAIILFCALMFMNIVGSKKSNIKTKSYTSFPKTPYKKEKPSEMPLGYTFSMSNPQQKVLPKLNISKSLKPTERNSFDCFDLPSVDEPNTSKKEFKSTLSQTSKLLKKKPAKVKQKQTNPLTRSKKPSSELLIPMVEDIVEEESKIVESTDNSGAELISVLNITPTKGFYLTTVSDTLALFGFINDNVFLLKQFKDLTQINLQARFYDKSGQNDLYIVRLDSYKAMIEISDTEMKELAKL